MNTQTQTQPQQEEKIQDFRQWCLVELFGHQKIVGLVSESTIGGGAFLQVEVPDNNGQKGFTRYFNPKAVYSLNPVTAEVARAMMDEYRCPPVRPYELPQLENRSDDEE